MASESKQNRIEYFEQACRERRLPVTTQRRAIVENILDREDHPTADQVYDQVRILLPTISRTTVYRILDGLVELGVITKTCHPGSAARFDPKTQQHHHLVCLHCENIIDLEEKRLNDVSWPDVRKYSFEISDYHIHFRGICKRCRKKLSGGAQEPIGSGKRRTTASRRRQNQQPSTPRQRSKR